MVTLQQRLEANISPEPNSGCWLWMGSIAGTGYGQLSRNRTLGPITAHRVSYELYKGPIGDKHVLHTCDVRSCCNPDHLYLGTNKENARDRTERGTARGPSWKGEQVHNALLNEDAVRDIKTRRLKGVEFARLYGVTTHTISAVLRGKNWKHI